jgi:hypothetical protein
MLDRIRFKWVKDLYSPCYLCEMPDNVTLSASPEYVTGFGTKAKRGTTWHAQASQWDQATRTISRFGREVYGEQQVSAVLAMRLAEKVYLEAIGALA